MTLALSLPISGLQAQEFLRSTSGNPVLEQALKDAQSTANLRSGGAIRDTLCLPFFDDFSNPNRWLGDQGGPCTDTVYPSSPAVHPNNLLWADRGAYINGTYPIDPPGYGVATLDGLNSIGKPYNLSIPYGSADTLSSRPIYLGGPLLDSVFLSFFYQAAGIGDPPDANDSLLLQFRLQDSTWVTVWSTLNSEGATVQPFRLVMINVSEPQYRYDGFQFRFRNYATRNGNNDHWHIDYVFLDQNRSRADTLFRDVAFSEPPPSMLNRYHSMPWRQFRANQESMLRSQMSVRTLNLFNTANNTNFQDSLLVTSSDGLIGITPSESAAIPAEGYYTYFHQNHSVPESAAGYNDDSMSLTWRLRLRPSGDINPFNDSLFIRQNFYNYYAYDDGSAERAYGLIGLGARLAYRFETTIPDTLYSVYIHWAYVTGGSSDKFFSLLVFRDIDTMGTLEPDSILYQDDFLAPKYPDSVNGWWLYNLREPLPIDGIFYIGWLQSQDGLLNVGFDRNTDASGQLFFNIGDVWLRSSLPGTVMMRPQTGPNYRVYPTLGIAPQAAELGSLMLYPNPSAAHIRVLMSPELMSRNWTYRIYDLNGAVQMQGQYVEGGLSIEALPPAMYMLELRDQRGQGWVSRFVRSP